MVTPMPPQPRAPGAIPLVLQALVVGLVPRHDVTMITIVGTDPAEQEAIYSLRALGVDVHPAQLVPRSGIPRWQRRWRLASGWLSGRYPWRTTWFWAPAVQQHLNRLQAQAQFDLIHIEDNSVGVYNYPERIPAVLTEHEVRKPRPVNWRGWTTEKWYRWLWRELDWQRWQRYQPTVWRRFDRIQVFTERDAQAMQTLAPGLNARVRVNPFGVVLPPAAEPEREESSNLLFVGNFTHAPNVDAALWLGHEIMPCFRQQGLNVCLTIVGAYPPETVQELATDDIIVTGRVPEVEPYLERAAVVLAPLRIGGGMRMKVLHAMALGKAVITTPRGAEGLAAEGQQPPLIVAEQSEDIASATAMLLNSETVRRQLGYRARAFVTAHYSPTAYVRRLEAIYAELQSEVRRTS